MDSNQFLERLIIQPNLTRRSRTSTHFTKEIVLIGLWVTKSQIQIVGPFLDIVNMMQTSVFELFTADPLIVIESNPCKGHAANLYLWSLIPYLVWPCFTSLRPCWSIKRGQWQPLTLQNTVDSILLYFSIYLVKARMEHVYATAWRSAVSFIYSMSIFNV